MTALLHSGTINVDATAATPTLTETYVVELGYVVKSDDVNKREAFMNQLRNLVKQYAPESA